MTFLTLFSVFVFIDINLKIPHKIMRTKKFIIFITASLLLSLLVSCISYSTSLFPSQVLSQSSNLQKKILRFIGTQEPKIQVFKGAQWGTETLQRIFKDGNWVFYPDGKFSFTPSLNAHVRSDLYPIFGTYKQANDVWELQGETQSGSASASVDGMVRRSGDKLILDIVYTIASLDSQRIANISQFLEEQSELKPGLRVAKIKGIPISSVFEISIQGKTEAKSFSSMAGKIKFLTPYKTDDNPFHITLSTDVQDRFGSLYLTSFENSLDGGITISKVTADEGQVKLEFNQEYNSLQSIGWWFTLSQKPIVDSLTGATIKRGTITILIKDDQVTGKIKVEGISWFNQPSTYEAQFIGKRQEEKFLTPASQNQENQENQKKIEVSQIISNFSGTWQTDIFGNIKLIQEGQKVTGTYTGKGGGTITGFVRENHLDFNWKDTKEGWGFFRVISGGRTLVGSWGEGTDKTQAKTLVANQTEQPQQNLLSKNTDELRYLGYDLVLQGKCNQALQPLTESLRLYKQARQTTEAVNYITDGHLIDEANIITRLSHCYSQLEDYDKLLQILRDAVEVRNLLNKIKYLRITSRQEANRVQENLTFSVEKWRKRLNEDLQKIDALDKSQPFFQELTKSLIELESYEEALVVAEKSRARALADILAVRFTKYNAQSPTLSQIQKIAQTQKATLIEYSVIKDQSDKELDLYIWVIKPTGEIAFRSTDLKPLWQQQSISLRDKVAQARKSIVTGVNISSRGNNITLTPGDRVKLKDDLPQWDSWEVLSVNPQKQTITVSLPSGGTGTKIDRPMTDVVEKVTNSASANTKNSQLQEFYQLLIQPIADLLPKEETARVIFIPQDALFLLPFPALQDPSGQYLIDKHTILTAPSIQVLDYTHKLRQKVPGSAKDILVVGNPIMPKVSKRPGESPQQLSELPGSEKEANAIASFWNTQALISNQATKKAVLAKLPLAKIIHLGTHGLLDDIQGLGSSIVFAPEGQDNGLLTAEDILNLYTPPQGSALSAELVVLSACDTGSGRLTGDGVIGLSRSIIAAGVPSVIVSLWSIPDAPTAELMIEFYQNFRKNPDKATALRQAMLTTKKKHPNPADWAAFTLIGESE